MKYSTQVTQRSFMEVIISRLSSCADARISLKQLYLAGRFKAQEGKRENNISWQSKEKCAVCNSSRHCYYV